MWLSPWLSQTNVRQVNTWVSPPQSIKAKQQNFWENNRLALPSTQIEVYCNAAKCQLTFANLYLYCAFSKFCITLLNQKFCVTSAIFKHVNLVSNITPSRHGISRTIWSGSTGLWQGALAAIHGTLDGFFPKFLQEHFKNPLKTNQPALSCDCPSFFVPNTTSFLFTVFSINQLHSNSLHHFIPKLDPSLYLFIDHYLLSGYKSHE